MAEALVGNMVLRSGLSLACTGRALSSTAQLARSRVPACGMAGCRVFAKRELPSVRHRGLPRAAVGIRKSSMCGVCAAVAR
eukprot:9805806-Alexandrium_andersonii.AAC.1